MENKIVLFDFDGVYKTQDFYEGYNFQWVDAQKLSGTNAYCDIASQEKINERMKKMKPAKINFLGSGNYHYMSLFLTERIKEEYSLVLFDNHTDMQKPVFEELLSCGGWVRTAILEDKWLKQVALVGTSETSLHNIEDALKEKVIAFPYSRMQQDPNWHIALSQRVRYPIYISIDKDVFSKKIAQTNWDQGKMESREFLKAFETITKTHRVIAMDVCGEYSMSGKEPIVFEDANSINNEANHKLLELGKRVIA